MTLDPRYDAQKTEAELAEQWMSTGVYHFDAQRTGEAYAIDTPPPSVSGHLHLGHVYSYTHADFFARFRRMRGDNVFYPMGYDDNGLPTERLVERMRGVRASEIGRRAFIQECLAVSEEAEQEYEALWKRLGLSVDWRYTYRTIDDNARRIAQLGFIDLYRKGLVYRHEAPTIWCPECRTAIAQAEVNDLDRPSTFYTLAFKLDGGRQLPIATTRPELLPACVAVFVHPDDSRFRSLIGKLAEVPVFGRQVPILADPAADPDKGTGAVMCCTFGDSTDILWWRAHDLPLIQAVGRNGHMTADTELVAGLTLAEARRRIVEELQSDSALLGEVPHTQSVRVHERCDTPVEYLVTRQWFVRVLDHREDFIAAGERIDWHPPHMKTRYRQWVENLSWDWCISRQRYFGVPFPVWYCTVCGEAQLADEDELPVDPGEQQPSRPCSCGSEAFVPESDVMDTWATSSLSPQIVGQWLTNPGLYRRVFPMTLRPQAHEIIRTWAFYTIVRSHYHFNAIPWTDVAISGWGLAPEGGVKLSKSRGGGPIGPMEVLTLHSADAVRYWAAGTGLGKDAVINEERIQAGAKWAAKLWQVGRFAERFLADIRPGETLPPDLTPADRWILARTAQIVEHVTRLFEEYDYATARSEIEAFFRRDLADNYIEMAKKRLYEGASASATYTLYHALLATLKVLAPIMPYVTDALYQSLFAPEHGTHSIHVAGWPAAPDAWQDDAAVATGELLVGVATAVRRFKSEIGLSLGAELQTLELNCAEAPTRGLLRAAGADLVSITRAREIVISDAADSHGQVLDRVGSVSIYAVL